jgi:hypothetical protein
MALTGVAGGMMDVVNDNLVVGRFVKHQIRTWSNNQTPDRWIVRPGVDHRVRGQEIDEGFDAGSDPRGALWRTDCKILENRFKVGKRR